MSRPQSASRARTDVARFSVLGSPITVRAQEPSALAAFRHLYALMPEAAHLADAPDAHQVEILQRGSALETSWDAQACDLPERPGTSLGLALQRAEASCCMFAIRFARQLVTVHAATVLFDNGLALITGDSGAGKTTLTLSLAARGRLIGGDDIAMLNPETGLVHGLPRCFHLDERSDRLLRDQGLNVREREKLPEFLTPNDVGAAGMQALPVKALFLLRPSTQSEPTVSRRPLSEAVALLDGQTGPRYRPSTQLFQDFSRMLSDATFFEVRRGPLGATADLVSSLMGELGP